MEGWREAVLAVDAFLGWKQEWHPAAIAGTITAVFLTIWYTDPSLLTLLATIGLFLTLADFIGPKVWIPLHTSVCHIWSDSISCTCLSDLGQDFQTRILDTGEGKEPGEGLKFLNDFE